jgi:hypothetical protein
MAESTAIQTSIDNLHSGADFIHKVATGPASGGGSEVANPVSGQPSQKSLARAIKDMEGQALSIAAGDSSEIAYNGLPHYQSFGSPNQGCFASQLVISGGTY